MSANTIAWDDPQRREKIAAIVSEFDRRTRLEQWANVLLQAMLHDDAEVKVYVRCATCGRTCARVFTAPPWGLVLDARVPARFADNSGTELSPSEYRRVTGKHLKPNHVPYALTPPDEVKSLKPIPPTVRCSQHGPLRFDARTLKFQAAGTTDVHWEPSRVDKA